jgi:hypothetical protein
MMPEVMRFGNTCDYHRASFIRRIRNQGLFDNRQVEVIRERFVVEVIRAYPRTYLQWMLIRHEAPCMACAFSYLVGPEWFVWGHDIMSELSRVCRDQELNEIQSRVGRASS